MQEVTPEWLQSIEALKEVPLDQLNWFIANSHHYELEEGSSFFKEGDPIAGTHVIIKGQVRLFMLQGKGIRDIAYINEGDISGYLPFSRGTVATISGVVTEHLQVMTYPVERIKELIVNFFELTQALVHIMSSRVRDFTTIQQQDEKMMALGKLSAGLAHELNNPAAAIVRSSTTLRSHLKLYPEHFKKVISIKMDPDAVDKVNDKLFAVLARNEKPFITLVQKTAMEDALAECLKGHHVDNSFELAENFVEFGFTCADIDEFVALIPPGFLSPVFNWINNNLVTEKMVNDIQEASQRIASLVNAVKTFTHMDRDQTKELLDIHSGISNTLTMLAYKLKKGNVQLIETYDTSLPKIKALAGQLNQVWTNLIDNALDAMEGKRGRLEIVTTRTKEFIEVFIIDNGSGIPVEIRNRIFDPFFTTKEIGKGTGLGLDVVTRIVKQHHGKVYFESQPGRTAFKVCLPINDTTL